MTELMKQSGKLAALYVEDNYDARETTLMVFNEIFKKVFVAKDGLEGYNFFQSHKNEIDIIITDINMPKLNGLDMIAKIRELDKDIPILVLSAYNESGFFIESIKLNVDGYILKPLDLEQFGNMLKKVMEKIDLKKELEKSLMLKNQYQEVMDEGAIISKTDPNGIITYVNDLFCKLSGYTKEELIGKNHNIIRHPDNPKSLYEDMWRTIKEEKRSWKGEIRNLSKNKTVYYIKTIIKPILDTDGNILEFIALEDNITDIMDPNKQLNYALKYANDPILLYISIEDYQTLEEFYEQEIIDKIEEKTRFLMEKYLPSELKCEKIYKLGKGRYGVVCKKGENYDRKDYIVRIKEFQEKIRDAIIVLDEIEYDISIIICMVDEGDYRMESAKLGMKKMEEEKISFLLANNLAQKVKFSAKNNIEIISKVKKAIIDKRVVSYFQAIINNKTRKIDKYESLVRIIEDNGKLLSPFFFLDISKKGRYYAQITIAVLENALESLSYFDKDISVSINISALDIEMIETRKKIFKLMDMHKNLAHRIIIEFLEDESAKNLEMIKLFIKNAKDMGAKIAIDDFGSGYSNFERIFEYQPDIIKIDGSLIKNIETNKASFDIVKTIIDFAKKQNIETVCEYVENENIFNILKELGADYSQGYYFDKPKPLSDIVKC